MYTKINLTSLLFKNLLKIIKYILSLDLWSQFLNFNNNYQTQCGPLFKRLIFTQAKGIETSNTSAKGDKVDATKMYFDGETTEETYLKWVNPLWDSTYFDEWGPLDMPEEHKHILIVEDDSATIQLFKRMILKSDETVQIKSVGSAEDAEKYLHHLRDNNLPGPDAAMIDYYLTGKDGLYVCELLENFFPLTKVIVVSGLNPKEIVKKLEERNLKIEFIPKPLDRSQIVHILKP
jgi:CheY-like chemotaxis protein